VQVTYAPDLVALVAATLTMGLVAGVFVFYAHTVMPGLGRTDDRTFVAGFQALDRAIINPWFMATGFLGALVFTTVAAALRWSEDDFVWVATALVLYVVTVVVTVAVNVPRNDALKAAGDVDDIADLTAVRSAFDEARWVRWNLLRVVTTTTAFGSLAWALVVAGGTRPGSG
jgi:uncharacterized membrane protein